MISPRIVAEVTDSTLGYVRTFDYNFEEKIVTKGNGLDSDLREQALLEHDHQCVKCDSENNLAIHHIIPYSDGGRDSSENLAPLCKNCHWEAHGDTWNDVDYNSKQEFWNWTES